MLLKQLSEENIKFHVMRSFHIVIFHVKSNVDNIHFEKHLEI